MEGFVFDLQRFAEYNDWPNILASNTAGGFFYRAKLINNVCEMVDTSADGASMGHYYMHVQKNGLGGNIYITNGSTIETNSNWTMCLNFNAYSEGDGFTLNIGAGDYKYNAILTDLPGCSVYGQSGKTVEATIQSGKTVKFYNCGTLNLATSPGIAEVHSNTVVNVLAGVTVSDVNLYADGYSKILNVRAGATVNSVEGTGTANVANGAVVKVGSKIFTGSKADVDSTLTVNGTAVTLTGGVFSYAGTDTLTLDSGAGVKYDDVTYTAGVDNSQCTKAANGDVTLNSGKFTTNGTSNVIVGGTTYAANSATLEVNNNAAILSNGTVTLDPEESVTVSGNGATSQIVAGAGMTINVSVNSTNGTYTISGLDGGKTVSIDGVAYTYDATNNTLLKDGVGWQLNGDSIGFTITNGTDTILANYGTAVVPDLKTKFDDIMGGMSSGDTLYFNADGLQQVSSGGAAYTLTKDAQDNYTLTSTTNSTDNLLIDLAQVTDGKLAVLTIDLTLGTTGAQQVKLKDGADLKGLTLGAGDSVLDSSGTTLAKAGTASGTVTVKNGGVKALTGGSFVGVGVHNIDATSADVTIDGVTFNQGAKGTFTNGETDAFEVTTGTATVGTTFSGTAKAHGVIYTVASGTAATFDATANTVTNFTSGKITLTAADNTSYTIGNQTISDGNGAELTFIAKDANNTYLCGTANGTLSLKNGESITVSDGEGNNTTTIKSVDGSTIDVAVGTDGKYTLSGLENEEKVSIGGRTYLYRADTKFLEEYNNTYPDGSGDGFILTNDGSITFNSGGTVDTDTATSMPSSLGEQGALDIISRAMPKGNTYYFDASGGRAANQNSAAYTLTKTADGSYVLESTDNCGGTLAIDASGITNLTVDFSKGNGTQTLNVDEKTELATGSKFGANDVIKYDNGTYVTCGSGTGTTTDVFLTPGRPMTIKGMTSGTSVSVAPGKSVEVGSSVYTAAGTNDLVLAKAADDESIIGVKSGTLSATSGTYTMLDNNGNKGDVVTVSGNAEVSTDGTGKATVKGLDSVGEKAVIKGSNGTTTYEVISPGIVKKVAGDGGISYWRVTGEATFTDSDTPPTGADGPLDGTPVSTQGTAEGTTYIDAKGQPTTDEAGKAATFTNNGGSKELEVTQTLELGVQLTGDTVTVKDKGTDTTYAINDNTSVTAKGATFTTQGGVLSDVTGTIKVASGPLDTKDGSDKAKYTLSGEGTKVNFQPGTSLSGTTVTTAGGNNIVIKENDNTSTTTVDSQGNVSGIDGNAEITGLPDQAKVSTTGSGTLALNGKTWKVEGDTDGAAFTVNTDAPGKLGGVAGLDEGATLSTEESVTGLVLAGCTITSGRSGITYTESRDPGNGTFTLTHDGDAITTQNGTAAYKVNKSGDGVTIGADGKLGGLTEGEKVTAVVGGATYTYEVSGGTLVTTKKAADGTITTTTSLLEAGETAFIIEPGKTQAANCTTDTSKIRDNTGFSAGSTEINQVSTVTNGMMLDKEGHATADSGKRMAEITIDDNGGLLKYESKQNIKQTVRIDNTSTTEWQITTSNKADTVEYGGSKEATITAGDGNDLISIGGAGKATINGVSGKNTIIHTGTGEASIVGGSGKDTIRSTNSGDTISGGGGENTYILTGAITHVTDFTYGQDKAVASSAKGALSILGVKTHSEGTIEYKGTGGTGGSLDVSDQKYGDFYAVTLADADGSNKLNVGWTGSKGGLLDASASTEHLLLVGCDEGEKDTLMGGQRSDTLIAGNGQSSMWGGSGNDLLISSQDDSNTIFFLAGDGNDTVEGFKALDANGLNTADTLDLYGQGVTGVKLTGAGIKLYHDSDSLLLSGNYNADSKIQWQSGAAKGIAKIGKENEENNFTYDAEVTNYLGSKEKDTLTLYSTDDAASIWLDGSQGVTYDSVEIVDASRFNGDAILAGGEGRNTIIGGKGESSLWGGAGTASDTLNAGSGQSTFYYGQSEGNDVINNAKAIDTVTLYNLSLSDLKGATIENSRITLTQQSGFTLTVNGKATDFTLSDGTTWSADYKTKTWSRVK